ncbi:MAG: DUF1800 family protein [Thermogutta sp.]
MFTTLEHMDTEPKSGIVHLSRCLRKVLGFVDPAQARRLTKTTPNELIQYLLQGEAPNESFHQLQDLQSQSAAAGNIGLYRTWRLRQFVESPHPFREMMTLFWLDVFAVSALRTKDLGCYHHFYRGVEERALAPWSEVLTFCLEHPAFLLNLRAQRNYRSQPNQQVGEFVVEHLMGRNPGQDRQSVNSVARAYTGLFVQKGELQRYEYEHDPAVKVIGDVSGDFWPRDVAEVLARDPNVAQILAGRIYHWFIGSEETIPTDFAGPMVNAILSGNSVGSVVAETIVASSVSGKPIGYRVKSPFEVFLALARAFRARVTTPLADLVAEAGWDILDPPTYNGWPKGRDWMTMSQLARRVSLAEILLAKEDRFGGGVDLQQAAKTAGYGDDWPSFLVDALSDKGIPPEMKGAWEEHVRQGPAAAARFLVALPEFQLS